MAFLDKRSERPRVVAPKRGFYSEAVANAPLFKDDKIQGVGGQGGACKRPMLALQVRTELYAPVIARIAPPPTPSSSPRDADADAPRKDFWAFAEAEKAYEVSLDRWGPNLPPAVEAVGGRLPRRVSVERYMRQFAHLSVAPLLSDVPAHLLEPPPPPGRPGPQDGARGLGDAHTFLPLHVFDDEEYDCRTWQEWLELGEVNGERQPVPVEAFLPRPSQGYRWVDAGAVDFDPELLEWTVLDGAKQSHRLPRLYVRFRAEDPALFCQRVREAVEAREEAEAAIRFNLFVDCMPVDDLDDMDQGMLGALPGGALAANKHSVAKIEQEVRFSYKRTMCQLLLLAEMERHPDVFDFLVAPTRPPEKVPALASVPVDVSDFPQRRSHAYWENLFAIKEASEGMAKVVEECEKVAEQLLFTSSFGRNVSLDEFVVQQTHTTTKVIQSLRTQWLQRVADNIRLKLCDVGKGWYSLKEKSWDLHLMSKMHRLLSVTRLRMEAALHRLVKHSLELLVPMVQAPCQCCLGVDDAMVWGLNLVESPFCPATAPIFHLSLKLDVSGPQLTTDPAQYKEALKKIFDDAVLGAHTIPPVDPMLMTNLVYPDNLALSSVGLMDPWVDKQRELLLTGLQCAAIPLQAYREEYHRFLDFYNLNVADYVSRYKEEEHTAAEFKEEVKERVKMRDNVLLTVPESIVIGPFLVNVAPARNALLAKSQALIDQMLQMYSQVLRTQLDAVLEEYADILTSIVQKPNSIEHVMEIRESMESAVHLIRTLEDTARRLLFEYEVLDYFWFSLSDDDFNAKWEAVAWPHKLSKVIANTTENLIEETQKFLTLHIGDEMVHQEDIEYLTERVVHLQGESNFDKVHELAIEISRIWKMMKEKQEEGLVLNRRQKLFDLPVTPYDDLNRLVKEFQPYRDLWTTASEWVQAREIWMDNPLSNVDGDSVERIIADSYKTMTKLTRTFAEIPLVQKVAVDVKEAIDDFRPMVPLLVALRNPGLRQRHFDELRQETGVNIKVAPNLTFKMCLEAGVQAHKDVVVLIAETAGKEYSIESALEKIEKEWEAVMMDVQPYKSTGTYIMKVTDEELQMLDDHILAVQQMSFSPFVGVFGKPVADWEGKLRLMAEVLEEWIQLQIQWMYLEPIFCSEDIARQLPAEMKKYGSMERFWRRIMKMASEYPKVLAICPDKRLLEQIKENRALLEQVLKGLSEYLEDKRMAFPRFYFLSDDELLEILAQNRNPLAVQPHLRKCFENIYKLHFDEADLKITTMFSAEGESVELIPHMYPKGNVEAWLSKVEETMQTTVQETLGQALSDMEGRSRAEWVLRWPGQVVIAGCQTAWTTHVEEAIQEGTLAAFQTRMHEYIDTYRALVRGQLSRMERQVMSALIVVELHARDVLDGLVEQRVATTNDFDWMSQLRYYWVEGEEATLKVRAVNAEFQYGYEYLGNSGRLVITPLTDRCYLTLTGALHLYFGGAPAGPAGTGKTETTKDLAKAMAIQCVVFNCSDQLDVQAMGKFFKGIASAGAWACFDEFNRIDIEVLSVVAQQVVSIQKALAARMQRFQFEGVEIALKPAAAVFITMNPGYAGRTELPDNLKALFRPVAMMVPNYTLIAEISLFSFGFNDARELANKITTTFKLSSEQLSSQDHYDFGMRAVKTVIAVAGNLKREKPDMGEPQIVLRAIRDVNVPKFLRDDLKLFNGIVSDLFPRLKEEQVDYGVLLEAIGRVCTQRGLRDVEGFVEKVLQLYDTTVVRHGLMLVGPTGSGKTKCYEVLKDAMTLLSGKQSPSGTPFTPVHAAVLNPKAITMGQLYGEFDAVTHEWTDGILPSLVRVGAAAVDADKRWFVFDGPVDAVWIENMNTVLDDNKKLCLTSGEIIKMTEHMTMMFEVADLAVASPATVSRCGMVYLEPGVLGLRPFLECWLRTLPQHGLDALPSLAEDLLALLDTYLLGGVAALRNSLGVVEVLASADICLVQGCLHLLDARLGRLAPPRPPPAAPFLALLPSLLAPWVALAVVWSVGATCDNASRHKFSAWLRRTMATQGHGPAFPSEGLVYDYRLHDGGFQDPTDDGEPAAPRWLHWMHDQEPYAIPEDALYSDIEVPTLDTRRCGAMLELLVTQGRNVACVGPTGTGKTLTVVAKLTRGLPDKYIADCLCFSARTSANQTQDVIDSKLDRRRKGVFGPPQNKRQLLFIDDFNMPALEVYGAQPPIELIRQWLDFQGWYDRKAVGEFRQIVDVNLVVAMGPPGGGRNAVTPRVMRHFHYLAFPELEDHSKATIFGTISRWWLERTDGLLGELDRLVLATLDVYDVVLKELLPTPTKTHYTFNVRDLSKVFQGVLMASPKNVTTLDQLLVLWYHENLRVYQDRLVNDRDRSWFAERLRSVLRTRFSQDPVGQETLYFGDVANVEREYVRITDVDKLSDVLQELLDDLNSQSTAPMQLVLFTDAMQHVCRIARVLRQPQGNALLLGMGGSGRRSLTKLAAFAMELTCYSIELSRAYGLAEWRDDIKTLLLKAGLHMRESVFLFSDTQIKSESFLEDLNSILNAGDVPNIYDAEELDKIYQQMRGVVTERGLQATRSNMVAAYQRCVKSNLHCIIAMSPIGDLFRARLRMFPALVNCCTIDWFSAWPDTALQSVALRFLSNIPDLSVPPAVLDGMVAVCRGMHTSVEAASELFVQELSRHCYVTPTSFLELLTSYSDLLVRKRAELDQGVVRLRKGLHKLHKTAEEVAELQKDLAAMRPSLLKAQQETVLMLDRIAADTVQVEKAGEEVQKEEKVASEKSAECAAIAEDAEADLAEAMPALREAEKSLQALNKNDISEVRALKKPPAGVVLVIEAICIAMGVPPNKVPGAKLGEKVNDFWTPGTALLASPDQFLSSLVNYDKENMTEEAVKKLKPYIENPQFQPSFVVKVSKACGSLCVWTHAIYKFYFVNLNVKPKKQKLAEANRELQATQRQLQATQERMAKIVAGLEALQAELRATESKKAELEARAQQCEDRMDRARRLLGGVASEQGRWADTVKELEAGKDVLIGDVLISAGAVAYLTVFTDRYRRELLQRWKAALQAAAVPHNPGCGPVATLGDPVAVRLWQVDGLPRDALSTESAVLVAHSRRWPLFIDPQGQANRWIRSTFKEKELVVLKLSDRALMRSLETAIRYGFPALLENVGEELDPALEPVLSRATFQQGASVVMKLGDTMVPYNPSFKLFITTKLANPHYLPEVAIKVLLVNFALVPRWRPHGPAAGPGGVGGAARPGGGALGHRHLVRADEAGAQGDRGPHAGAVVRLRGLARGRHRPHPVARGVQAQVGRDPGQGGGQRGDSEGDRPHAGRLPPRGQPRPDPLLLPQRPGAPGPHVPVLARVVHGHLRGGHARQRQGRGQAGGAAGAHPRHQRRLHLLAVRQRVPVAVRAPQAVVRRAGVRAHPPVPRRHPARRVAVLPLRRHPRRDGAEPGAGVALPAGLERATGHEEAGPAQGVCPELPSRHRSIQDHLRLGAPPWSRLDGFQRLLLLRALRPDKLTEGLQGWLTRQLGARFVEPQAADVATMFKDASPTIPLVFVLSAGTDPAQELFVFADKMRMAKRLGVISLGQGQGPRAEAMLLQAMEDGSWVFFQNCHLAPSWMPRLEQLLEGVTEDGVHRDFRLWLTSTPSPSFPVAILQASSKMTVEPPRGVKANLLRAFLSQIPAYEDLFNSQHSKALPFRRLALSLTLFHAVVLERRKFGALGFNIPYEFTEGDLRICLSQLHMFLMEYHDVPVKVMRYTAGQINYGGRVTDDWDRRTIAHLLSQHYDHTVVQADHEFDDAGIYKQLPDATLMPDYLTYLRTLPINDRPQLFGLHPNADISCAQNTAYSGLAALVSLQPRAGGGGGGPSAEQASMETATALLRQIPPPLDVNAIMNKYPVSYEESFNTVLVQEVLRYNKLLATVTQSLQDLVRAVQGLVVMSAALEAVADSLAANAVPQLWAAKAYPSLKPLGAWVSDLRARLAFLATWAERGIPAAFWISGFYFPQAFLTGTLQNYARKHVVSIDTIGFAFRVLADRPSARPQEGCVIYGLFMEGARWHPSEAVVAESLPKELYTDMPPMLLLPEPHHKEAAAGLYVCPVYKTLQRAGTLSTTGHSTNYVLAVELASKRPQGHWVGRGVALFCALDY